METFNGDELVKKINVNKEAVIDRIIDLYSDKIFKICFLQLGDKEEAKDATQEVLLKVFKYINRYNGEASIYTWIYRITINTCFDILKKRKRQKYEDISLHIEWLRDTKETEAIIIKNLTSQKIREVLMKVDEKYRILLYMYYYEELKISEIASILQEKENTIKTRLRRGKSSLRRLIESEGI